MTGTTVQPSPRSRFLRNVLTLTGGNALALVLPILAAPLLGRIYHPAEYAALAQYMAAAGLFSVIASLQFHHAIIAEATDRAANDAYWLCILSGAACSLLALLGVAVLWPVWLFQTAAGAWFFWLPLGVMASGFIIAATTLTNRVGRYRGMAGIRVVHVTVTISASIWLGLEGWSSSGLMVAYLLGQLTQVLVYAGMIGSLFRRYPLPRLTRLRVIARRHRRFPIFTMPGAFCYQLNMQLPVFVMTAIGAEAALGAFNRARQLVSAPVTTIGQAVMQIFRRDAAQQYRKTGDCRPIFLRTALGLFAVGLPFCLLLMATAPSFFELYLGPAWREAGDLARILAPMLLMQVVTAPLSTVFFFTGHQALDFGLKVISSVTMIVLLCGAMALDASVRTIVICFALALTLTYLISFLLGFKISRQQ
ncbi:colanic acid exporter [Roseivivax jejudonensis]|uniref:Colanic acid exporter n=1 Tax=Roseivivax jejudonensis TaxID=1529041 RepID=A0A1X6Y626_9RHOB|nr:oligosaccharide flippase family protein [Roseivivax jejudonensis]SLN11635.1 colanic acid exporter [Roseivivax jejudonensis]